MSEIKIATYIKHLAIWCGAIFVIPMILSLAFDEPPPHLVITFAMLMILITQTLYGLYNHYIYSQLNENKKSGVFFFGLFWMVCLIVLRFKFSAFNQCVITATNDQSMINFTQENSLVGTFTIIFGMAILWALQHSELKRACVCDSDPGRQSEQKADAVFKGTKDKLDDLF